MIPAVPMMTASAERVGVTVVVATSLVNLAYAVGETIGAPTAALLSTASSDAVPFLALAGLMLLSLVLVRRSHRTALPAPAAGAGAEAGRLATGPAPPRPPPARPAAPDRRRDRRPTASRTPPIAAETADRACSYPGAELAHGRLRIDHRRVTSGCRFVLTVPAHETVYAVPSLRGRAPEHRRRRASGARRAPRLHRQGVRRSPQSRHLRPRRHHLAERERDRRRGRTASGPRARPGPTRSSTAPSCSTGHSGSVANKWSLPGKVDGISGDGSR